MKRLISAFIIMVAIISGCSSVKVSQDYDLSKGIPSLEYYDWFNVEQEKTGDIQVDNPLFNKRVRSAIDRTLTEKGYGKSGGETVDFRVRYQYSIKRKLQTDDFSTGIGFGVGRSGRYGGVGVSSGTSVSEYDQGMLVVDILKPGTDELIWRGTGTRRVSDHTKPEEVKRNVNDMVEKILGQFPSRQ